MTFVTILTFVHLDAMPAQAGTTRELHTRTRGQAFRPLVLTVIRLFSTQNRKGEPQQCFSKVSGN